MARFTELTDADVSALMTEFGGGTVKSWKALDEGTINSNFQVQTDVDRFFLRINENKSEADVAHEAGLVRELAERGVRTPLPWRAKDERPYAPFGQTFASLFRWVSGEHMGTQDVGGLEVEQVGRALARMHLAGEGLDERYQRPSFYGFEQIKERYTSLRDPEDPKLVEALSVLGREIAWLEERIDERERAPKGIIHGDLFPDNLLFHDQGVTLLDFEQACWGSLVYDLAVCITAWCYGRKDFHKGFVNDLVAGYQKERPLSGVEKDLLYTETRAAAIRFTITRITDVYLSETPIKGKDFRRYLARVERLRDLDADEFAGWTGAS